MAKIQRRDTEIFWFSHHCRTSGPACHTGSTQPRKGISWEDFFSLWNVDWWTWCWWSCLPPACPRRPSLAPLSSESQSPSRPRTHSSRRSLQGPPARKIFSPTHKIEIEGCKKHLEGERGEIRCYKHRLHVYGQIHQPSWTFDMSRSVFKNTHFQSRIVFQRKTFNCSEIKTIKWSIGLKAYYDILIQEFIQGQTCLIRRVFIYYGDLIKVWKLLKRQKSR